MKAIIILLILFSGISEAKKKDETSNDSIKRMSWDEALKLETQQREKYYIESFNISRQEKNLLYKQLSKYEGENNIRTELLYRIRMEYLPQQERASLDKFFDKVRYLDHQLDKYCYNLLGPLPKDSVQRRRALENQDKKINKCRRKMIILMNAIQR